MLHRAPQPRQAKDCLGLCGWCIVFLMGKWVNKLAVPNLALMTVISAGQPLCGWELRQPSSPEVTPVRCSGVYFHFLPPFGARALRFCLVLKNPAPTLGPTNPCVQGALWSHCWRCYENPKEGRRPIFKSWQWRGMQCSDFQMFQNKEEGRHGVPPGGPREERPSFFREMRIQRRPGRPPNFCFPSWWMFHAQCPFIFLNISYEHLNFILFFKYLLYVFVCSGLHCSM